MKDNPKQIFNWYLWFSATFMALPGVAKGFDEGCAGRPVPHRARSDSPLTLPLHVQKYRSRDRQ